MGEWTKSFSSSDGPKFQSFNSFGWSGSGHRIPCPPGPYALADFLPVQVRWRAAKDHGGIVVCRS
jgi:hypothetical protein